MFQFDKIQQKLFAIMGIIIVILAGILFFKEYKDKNSNDLAYNNDSVWEEPSSALKPSAPATDLPAEKSGSIKIYLTGEVANPGILELQEGDRIADAVKLAGGALPEADLDRVNLALKVKDEGMYYIPKLGEEIPEEIKITHNLNSSSSDNSKININTADLTQLQTLNGIGPSKAQKIIDYRKENGDFKSIEEIMNVSGIGEKTFAALKEQIDIR